MKLEPVNGWIAATVLLTKKQGTIIVPNVGKGDSRCYLIDAVSPEAEAAGYKPGDIVVAKAVYDMPFKAGTYYRAMFPFTDIISRVRDVTLDEFLDIHGKDIQPIESAA